MVTPVSPARTDASPSTPRDTGRVARKREAIRARFELRFSATAMARRYLDVYGDMLARRPYAEVAVNDVVVPRREGRSFASLG